MKIFTLFRIDETRETLLASFVDEGAVLDYLAAEREFDAIDLEIRDIRYGLFEVITPGSEDGAFRRTGYRVYTSTLFN